MKATIGARGGAEALARVHGCVGMEEWFRPHTLTQHGPNPITGLDSDATVVYRFGIDAWGWAWSCGGAKGRGVTTIPSHPHTPHPPHPSSHRYLVDPASSHMLVSKIKPCMSKYKRLYCETAKGSLNQL